MSTVLMCVCTKMYVFSQVVPRNGAWNMEHRQFCKGVDIEHLAVAVCAPNRPPSEQEIL